MEFKSLFDIVHANLRSRDLARGGEEMLRLRAYEKLQNLVQAGIVKKAGKEYSGVPKALVAFFETAAELNAKFASGKHCRPPFKAPEAQAAPTPKAVALEARAARPAPAAVKRAGAKLAKVKSPLRKASRSLAKQGRKSGKTLRRSR